MKKTSFNDGWLFAKAGGSLTSVTIPHDAMIHEPRNGKNPSGSAQAFFPGGKYAYQKTFQRPRDAHAVIQFEGVYKNARVFINDREAGGNAYGYLPFFICADGFLKDGDNVLRVECENAEQPDSRWYTGAGIYRPVWLWTGPADAIEPESIKIETVSINPPTVRIEIGQKADVQIMDGPEILAKASGDHLELSLPGAKLWSEDSPYLYTCQVKTKNDEAVLTFGIRTVTWDNKGFYINGIPTLLRGGCVHHDNGILGAATWDESEYRRIRKLKEAGYNAIRSAHNPCSRAMLDACDKLGVYVMDESWDMWFHHKNKFDYASQWRKNYLSDLQAMVNRDRNHPSVIMYSIGNEVSEPAKPEGVEKTREMVNYLHKLDPTRPVTGGFNLMIIANAKKGKGVYKEEGGMADDKSKATEGMNSTLFNFITNMVGTGMNKSANGKKADEATAPCLDALDLAGYNYASGRYPLEGKVHPGRLIFGSETFPQDISKNWEMVKKYPYLIGDFMWTAWDYLGEAGLGAWAYTKDGTGFNKPYPWLLADTGALDILGNPNGEMFQAQATWGILGALVIAVQPLNHPGKNPAKMAWRGTNAIPSWSWSGCEGNTAIVEVYTDTDAVELFLNNKSLGKKKAKAYKALFKTKYVPGKLTAVAIDPSGKIVSRSELVSANRKLHISVTPDRVEARPGQLVYAEIAIADENGEVESNADRKLTVTVENGRLLAFGSANPRTEEHFDAGSYTTYYGKALAAVLAENAGELIINVSDGLQESQTAIKIEK